ncbi:uncharacterized protein A1O5_02867 [Cladophialophora psammophila CBS 110553]|uniref:Uncharacterized protein n=1 Tax=Cladophialophora psammophila CBS 110553 TaxID=1182543 RepID=W9XCA7_9EURO|nr:uncharacterized protein A1O5_02867 [Cladophialophora psammophila CBS 110553]EXJ74571.1 hypothetical protein A1O5_02867 [Cladophialophora psammophila CBS 110553]
MLGFGNTALRNLGTGTILGNIPDNPPSAHAEQIQPTVVAFKNSLPRRLKEMDPDFYLISFQGHLALQIAELTVSAKRSKLPQHLVPPLAYLRALSHSIDQISQPAQHTTKVTQAKKCEQIQRFLDSLADESGRLLENEPDGQDKGWQQEDGLQHLVALYDSDLRKQLESLKPRVVEDQVIFGTIVLAFGVLILLIYFKHVLF